MGRYDNTSITVNRKGERVRIPTLYPEIPLSDSDQFVYPKDGDRLDLLANQFYGDSTLWWFIAHVNDIYTMNIPVGTSLRIPPNDSLAMMG